MTHLEEFQKVRISVLETEINRLNLELGNIKQVVLNSKITDTNFLKPINEVEFFKNKENE